MRTIKNNDPDITYYLLSITELVELCEQYHDSCDEEDFKNKTGFIELYVDYIENSRNK